MVVLIGFVLLGQFLLKATTRATYRSQAMDANAWTGLAARAWSRARASRLG